MRSLVLILFSLLVAIPVVAQIQIPKDSGSGYQRIFTVVDEPGFYDVGKAFPLAIIGFERGSAFVGELFACQGPAALFSSSTCDLLVVLDQDIGIAERQTTRLYYVVQITTAETGTNQSRLIIRGTESQISGTPPARFLITMVVGPSTTNTAAITGTFIQNDLDLTLHLDSGSGLTINPDGAMICNLSGQDILLPEIHYDLTVSQSGAGSQAFVFVLARCNGCSEDSFPQLVDGGSAIISPDSAQIVDFQNTTADSIGLTFSTATLGSDDCTGIMVQRVSGGGSVDVRTTGGTFNVFGGSFAIAEVQTFTNLIDVNETTYSGFEGQSLVVNDAGTGIEFRGLTTGAFAFGYRFDTDTDNSPTSGRAQLNNTDPLLATEFYVHELAVNGENASLILGGAGEADWIGVLDDRSTDAYIYLITGPGVLSSNVYTYPIAVEQVSPAGSIVNNERVSVGILFTTLKNFTGLLDTPNDYTGQAGELIVVNTGETALEFTVGGLSFIDLADTEVSGGSYSGEEDFVVTVNPGGTGLTLVKLPERALSSGTFDGTSSSVLVNASAWVGVDLKATIDNTFGDAALELSADRNLLCNTSGLTLRGVFSLHAHLQQSSAGMVTLRAQIGERTGEGSLADGDEIAPEDMANFLGTIMQQPISINSTGDWQDGQCRGLMLRRSGGVDKSYMVEAGNYAASFFTVIGS